MDDGAVCSLERPAEAPDLTDREKAALHYADLLATDHLAVDDATFEELGQHFSDEEVLELGVHIGTCVGFGRLAATFDLVDALPDAFRGAAPTPWADGSVLR
jgi:alkylhydroperoxidase family enzyme